MIDILDLKNITTENHLITIMETLGRQEDIDITGDMITTTGEAAISHTDDPTNTTVDIEETGDMICTITEVVGSTAQETILNINVSKAISTANPKHITITANPIKAKIEDTYHRTCHIEMLYRRIRYNHRNHKKRDHIRP